jgi:hypothetical protein
MTSINALRLDRDRGLLICDEARYWNPEWMIFYTPEKIRAVAVPPVSENLDLILFMGQTGTSSVGDEFIDLVERSITRWYREECERLGHPPQAPLLADLAARAFEVVTAVKHQHVDDYLQGRFGFSTRDLVRGSIERAGREIPLQDKDIVAEAHKLVTWEGTPDSVKAIFGNSQILAGHTPADGFRMFYMTERTPVCEEVDEVFTAWGSGRDTCDLAFCKFADALGVEERRGKIDPARGLVALLRGLNDAFRLTAGVAGYPKIMYVDGTRPRRADRIKSVFDMHAKLASEIVMAGSEALIPDPEVYVLVDDLIFRDAPFGEVNRRFFEAAPDKDRLARFLRGYPTAPASRGIA